jgi:hypothetical protein
MKTSRILALLVASLGLANGFPGAPREAPDLSIAVGGDGRVQASASVSAAALSPSAIISVDSGAGLAINGDSESNASGVSPLDHDHVAVIQYDLPSPSI